MDSEQLKQIAIYNKGIIQTSEATNLGISKPSFYKFISEHNFIQVNHGIYLSPDSWLDTMYVISLRSKLAVFSHETALLLHNLTDREPAQYSITVKTGYNPSKLKADGIKVYTIKKELYDVGLIEGKTPFGHVVRTYDMERTICDILRSRSTVETQSFQDALKQYTKRKDKRLRLLMQYAHQFRVDKILNKYLEVLL